MNTYRIQAKKDDQTVEEGDLIIKQCITNDECPEGGYVGAPICQSESDNVWQLWEYALCENNGCTFDTKLREKTICTTGCVSGGCRFESIFKLDTITNINPPNLAQENQEVSFKIRVENQGNIYGTATIQGAIVPEDLEEGPVDCDTNEFYEKTITLAPKASTYVTFNVKAPNQTSECGLWSNEHKIMIGVFNESSTNYIDSASVPYTIEPDIHVACGHMPDGSSEIYQCFTDSDCTIWDSRYECNLGAPGFKPCVLTNQPDKCDTIDEINCENNALHRCEQTGTIKDWKLVKSCTDNELCVESTGQCENRDNYDLILDNAPGGLDVNKNPFTTLKINVKITGFVEPMSLEYDENVLTFIEGISCQANSYTLGENICYFEINGEIGTKTEIKFGEEKQTVKIIGDNPKIAYLTNKKQLLWQDLFHFPF